MNSAPRPHQLYIVDDSAAIHERLVDMLSHIDNVNVVGHAVSAPHAVVDILALRPDTVILDLELQGSNGLDVLRAIHPQMPEVTFVVLTNHSEPQYRRACSHAGAAHFLDKNTEFHRVREIVATIPTRH